MMELSKRLQAVADLVTAHYKLADIGTDHAYIPIYLTEHKKVKKAFAMQLHLMSMKDHCSEQKNISARMDLKQR